MRDGGSQPLPARAAKRAAALLVCLLLAGLAWASWASAAETLVNFDTLKAGEEVKTQYEAEGLRVGLAGEFGRSSPKEHEEGNCGAPTVKAEGGGIKAVSPPNYALLAKCPHAGPDTYEGTYGALLGHPRTSISVEVSNLQSTPPVELQLIAYNGEGHQVASDSADAENGKWRLISIADETANISYFMIRTAKEVTPGEIGIDNLSFGETPVTGLPEALPPPTPPSPPAPPAPPIASLSLQTPNPAPGQLLTLSGATSQAGSGHIIAYNWDFNGDGKIDTSTGTDPVAHLILPPGPHTIGLTVVNSKGESSSTKLGLLMPLHIEALPPPDGGQGPCEPTLEEGDAQIVAECIQRQAGGGYVIETKQLGLNGMDFAPKSGGYGVFTVSMKPNYASLSGGTLVTLSGPDVNIELLNTPIGDVVLGGRDLQSEPIQLAVLGGGPPPTITFNHGLRRPRAHAAGGAPKTLLVAVGVAQPCKAGEKGVGCCPPGERVSCATLPAGFPLVGQVDIYLTNRGGALLDAQVGLALKGVFEATGAIEISAEPTGINLNSLMFTIPQAGLDGIFTVKKASFVYYFPGAPEESKRDTWQAKGEIVFGPLGEPALEVELAFKKGNFHSGKLAFTTPPPGIPIFTGVFLNKLGGEIGNEPFTFGGSLGAKIAGTLEVTVSFRYREPYENGLPPEPGRTAENPESHLGFFGVQGTLELNTQKIATVAGDVYSDGYVDASVNVNLQYPEKAPVVQVGGSAGFWDEPNSGLWQVEGSVYLKIWVINAEVAGVVNNKYIAGCLGANGAGISGHYSFVNGGVGGGFYLFSNCSDQLKEYKQKPLVMHSGGFVGGESLRLRGHPASAVAGDTFTLPAGQAGQELRLSAHGGSPVVTLIAPGGQTYTTPASVGQIASVSGQFIAAISPDPDQVLIMLKHPQGGNWRVQPAAGSPPLEKLEVAGDAPPATVKVRVSHGHGSRFSLAYKIANYLPGTSVRFFESGRDSRRVLGTVQRAAGSLGFVPEDAAGRSRMILADLLNAEGVPVRELPVGSYRAPAAFRPGRPARVRIVRRGLTAVVSWGRAAGASSYRLRVLGSDGRLETPSTKGSSYVIPNVLAFETFAVTVQARGGPLQLVGPSAAAHLTALKPPKPRTPGEKTGKHGG